MSESGLQAGAIVGIIIGILTFITPLFIWCINRMKRRRKYYTSIWKKPKRIKYKKILAHRPYHETYWSKKIDSKILECLKKEENVLILGKPLAGKSRTIFEVIKQLNKTFSITIIRARDINEDDFLIPIHFLGRKKKKLIIIDDLHSFIERDNFKMLLDKFIDKNSIFFASSRSGFEFTKMKKIFIKEMGFFETFFDKNIFHIEDVSVATAKAFSQKIGIQWNNVEFRFDKTLGSLIMPLEEMWKRFTESSDVGKIILRELKKINELNIRREMNIVPIEWIKEIYKYHNLNLGNYEFKAELEKLQEKEFLILSHNNVITEEVYLEQIVEYDQDHSTLEILSEMIKIYLEIPKMLYKIGNKAQILWMNTQMNEYLTIAKNAYEYASQRYSITTESLEYSKNLNNLSNIYREFGRIENNIEYFDKAMNNYLELLEFFLPEKYLKQYAVTMINVISTFNDYFNVKEEWQYFEKSLENCKTALNFVTKEDLIGDFAVIKFLQGCTYSRISSFNNEIQNLHDGIDSLEEAMSCIDQRRNPFLYYHIVLEFAMVYRKLAKVENRDENCCKSKELFLKAEKFYSVEIFPDINKVITNNLNLLLELCQEEERN